MLIEVAIKLEAVVFDVAESVVDGRGTVDNVCELLNSVTVVIGDNVPVDEGVAVAVMLVGFETIVVLSGLKNVSDVTDPGVVSEVKIPDDNDSEILAEKVTKGGVPDDVPVICGSEEVDSVFIFVD